ncbi:choice-of-anchor W domain-containing protein [Halalkalirubrum salinum]|uniref:choice-of-anchor W domain-containing protein n=1 Tax=Halalkalirubrum salinum TaxID=2563889 RepID=UPI0010FAFD2A|nr:choice-of-anchor W domain-containing protein [Halalkalirubrum salinum]
MNDDNRYGLSRRKALGGIGIIGLASAGAGMGTTAFFSDEESFEDNSLEAGELDLYVHYDFYADQGEKLGEYTDSGTVQGDESDGASVSYGLEDVKPGDSGELEFSFSIVDNDAYMWMCGELTENNENGRTEPEAEVDDTGGDPGEGRGELADSIEATLYYYDQDGDSEESEIFDGTLRGALLALRNGVPLDGEGAENPVDDRNPFEGNDSDGEQNDICVLLDWEIDPEEVGNEIQTDSVGFDLSFYAEQSRHNDGTNNPCVTGREGEDFAKLEDELEDASWHARGIYGDGGGAANRELDIRLPDDTPVHSGNENFAWPNSQDVPFELTIENGDAIWSVDGNEVTVEDAPIPMADGVGVTAKSSKEDAIVTVENIMVNGSTPSGATSVSAEEETNHIILEGATLQEGDVISGDVTFEWDDEPSREELGFRVDV